MNAHEFYKEFITKVDEDRVIGGKQLLEIYKSSTES